MEYTTKLGCNLLRKRKPVPNIPQLRWSDTSHSGFKFCWKANWRADRACKESGLIWHLVVAVNEWGTQISPQLDTDCLTCCTRESETIMHLFWSCHQATMAWTFALKILTGLLSTDRHLQGFNSHHALFTLRMPRRFQTVGTIWVYLRSVTLWTLWVARNDSVFN
jgi:hypothetical protein